MTTVLQARPRFGKSLALDGHVLLQIPANHFETHGIVLAEVGTGTVGISVQIVLMLDAHRALVPCPLEHGKEFVPLDAAKAR